LAAECEIALITEPTLVFFFGFSYGTS